MITDNDFKVGDRIQSEGKWGIVLGYDRAKVEAGKFSGFDVLFDGDEKITIYCNPWKVIEKNSPIKYTDYDQWKESLQLKGVDRFEQIVGDNEAALKNNIHVGIWLRWHKCGFVF